MRQLLYLALNLIHLTASFQCSPVAFRSSGNYIGALSSALLPPTNDFLFIWYQLVNVRNEENDSDGAFAVEMPVNALNFQLCKAIVSQEKNKLAHCDPSGLQVFATRKDFDSRRQLKKSQRLSKIPSQNSEDNPLYILVPNNGPFLTQAHVKPPIKFRMDARLARLRRWDDLNEVIAKNKKSRVLMVPSAELQPVYEPITEEYKLQAINVEAETIDNLYDYLTKASTVFGTVSSISEGTEAMRLHFIAPVLVHVCNLLEGQTNILVETVIDGKRVKVNSMFEFILQRKKKRICIVEAKRDDMAQGLAQNLLGLEAVADTEDLDCVYGIVTNYFQWMFIKSLDNRVEKCGASLEEGSKESLAKICGFILAMLSE